MMMIMIIMMMQICRIEADAFRAALPEGGQAKQATAVRAAISGDDADLLAVRHSRNIEKPLLPGVTRRYITDRLCLYLPENGKVNGTLVYFHGGCWVFGSVNSCSSFCMAAAKKGLAVVASNYPLAPENGPSAIIESCMEDVRYVMDHADEWGGSADMVSVGGDSAGGNLSLAVALRWHSRPAIRSLVLYYPVTKAWADGSSSWKLYGVGYGLDADLMEAGNEAYARDDRRNPLVSPACADDEALRRLPPCRTLAAGRDILLDQGLEFHRRLLNLGIDSKHETVEGATHLFVTVPGQPTAFARAVSFAVE